MVNSFPSVVYSQVRLSLSHRCRSKKVVDCGFPNATPRRRIGVCTLTPKAETLQRPSIRLPQVLNFSFGESFSMQY